MHSDENDALSAVTLSSYPHYALVYLGYGHTTIEIINNARGGIEGKIGERDVWGGGNSSPGCSLIHDVPDKKENYKPETVTKWASGLNPSTKSVRTFDNA